MQVSTFLWFDGRAEEVAAHYTGVFPGAEILHTDRDAEGRVTTVTFDLAGHRCVAYNGSPRISFTGAMSLYAECATQEEVDVLWAGLTDGGTEGPGGSLTDRFGVTWQVVPQALGEILADAGPEAAERVLTALHAMTKIEIKALLDARDR